MSEIDVVAVVVAALASFAFGALWYSPVLFLPRWMKEAGVGPEQQRDSPVKVFGGSFVCTLVSVLVLAYLLGPEPPVGQAVGVGTLIGVGLVAASLGVNYLFAGRSAVLWLIDGAFHVGRLAVAGLIIALWP